MDDLYLEIGYESYEDFLLHSGVGHLDGGHSGRYPWGSGKNPFQHADGKTFYAHKFLARYNELKKSGLSEHEIFVAMGLSKVVTDDDGNIIYDSKGNVRYTLGMQRMRAIKAIANDEVRRQEVERAKELYAKLQNYSAVARAMGKVNAKGDPQDTTIKALLDADKERNMNKARNTADILKKEVEAKKFVDVGAEVERDAKLGVSKEMKLQALELLKMEGYAVYPLRIPQQTNPGKDTTALVLFKDDPNLTEKQTWAKLFKELKEGNIMPVGDFYSDDGGKTFQPWHYPESFDSSRLEIRYKEQGGSKQDGLIELRPGVEDISLGDAKYSQVRIMVDDKYYMKGVACYADDLPPGVDIRFNSNKKEGAPLEKVLKECKGIKSDQPLGPNNPIDPNDPFGSLIKEGPQGQRWYDDPKTGEKKLSVINKRADEGDWNDWDDSKLPSQFAAKQDITLTKRQLNLAIELAKAEYRDICSLTNPTIKKYYLEKFADSCDTAARDLDAAALPRQKYQVIVPANSLGNNEIYAPNYKSGETVAVVRFPFGGNFEMAICKVNNKNQEARKRIGEGATDAVCINHNVAERLSGADFDGDTVLVIPVNSRVPIKEQAQLSSLAGFDHMELYSTSQVTDPKTGKSYYVNDSTGARCKLMTKGAVQREMGTVSNLIMDMTLRGAPFESPDGIDIAHAVRHSMVVIDAYKHKLDYKTSEIDNHIAEMKAIYQEHYDLAGRLRKGGASTIVTRAAAEARVKERYGEPKIDKETGEVIYKQRDREYAKYSKDKNGEIKVKYETATTKVHQMDVVGDANQLVSTDRAAMELVYADYANARKAMANEARKELIATKERQYSASAKEVYRNEVASLNTKLNEALKNAPRERRAQVIAGSIVEKQKADNPGMTKEELRKARQKAANAARAQVGSIKRSDRNIFINDREWEAIQAGAFPATSLRKILDNTDPDTLRERAMPKTNTDISDSIKARIKALGSGGWTNAEIAEKLHVSPSTVAKYRK